MNLQNVNRVLAGFLASLALGAAAAAQGVKLEPAQQKITAASNVRARGAADTTAPEVARLKLGTVVTATARTAEEAEIGGRRGHWYFVSLPSGNEGWVFGGLLADYDGGRRSEIARSIIAERMKAETMTFEEGADLYNFVAAALAEAKTANERAELELSLLRALGRSVTPIPYAQREQAPYRDWLKTHDKQIFYHELAGSFHLASEALWELEKKHRGAAAADEIAWEAARNPVGGECEGDVVCNFLHLSGTEGRYLSLYPNGAHASEALQNLQAALAADELKTTLDSKGGDQYQAQARADLRKALVELRAAVSKVSAPEKADVLRRIDQLVPAGR